MSDITILLLAAAAAFLGFRLFSVLGKRTGHEQTPQIYGSAEESAQSVEALPSSTEDEEKAFSGERIGSDLDPSLQARLNDIKGADREFSLAKFTRNVRSAYEVILTSFWEGDKETLRSLCEPDIYDIFASEIDKRKERGESWDNRFIRINDSMVVEARLDRPIAQITLKFRADIAAVIRDENGKAVAGSLSDAVETNDIWTFQRNINSAQPIWTLAVTDSE